MNHTKLRHFHPKFYLPPYSNLWSKVLYQSQNSVTLAFYLAMLSAPANPCLVWYNKNFRPTATMVPL